MVPREIEQWTNRNYPKPQVDPEWLAQCYNYLVSELGIARNDITALTKNIESQLLQSDLHDSTLPQTGLPENPASLHAVNLPPFLLLQVVSIMEIGHSAFSLQNTRQAWIEKADLAGLAAREDDGEYSAGEFPRYPRGMLSLELSDGYNVIKAIEYRRLDGLKLGETPLGYKIVLKNVSVRRGVAMLQPNNVELRGYSNQELDANRDAVFTRGLKERMGLPVDDDQNAQDGQEPPTNAGINGQQARQQPAAPPRAAQPPAGRQQPPPPRTPRTEQEHDPSVSPYFPNNRAGPSVPLPRLPVQSRLEDEVSIDDFEFEDDMDDSFLRQVDAVERQATTQSDASRSAGTRSMGVIAISDSEDEDKENIPMPQRKRPRREEFEDVIELSD